jgi:hypothetical protein
MAHRTRRPHADRPGTAARPAPAAAVVPEPVESPPAEVPAGDLSRWLRALRATLEAPVAGEQQAGADVPCGGCTACCESSQFVHIAPDETETLRHIPAALRFPAPYLPPGHVLLGYDEQGRCPMLTDEGCSIYEHRPRTCRTYDCRVFAATGVDPGPEKPAIRRRVRSWVFTVEGHGTSEQAALRSAAGFLMQHPEVFGGDEPPGPTQLAVLAVEVVDHFRGDGPGEGALPDVDEVRVAVARRRRNAGA